MYHHISIIYGRLRSWFTRLHLIYGLFIPSVDGLSQAAAVYGIFTLFSFTVYAVDGCRLRPAHHRKLGR